MDQPAQASPARPAEPAPGARSPGAADPDALPPSPARRAQLLFILIVLPVVAVSLPAILVTLIFGQKPKPKAISDTKGLDTALRQSADRLLPTPPALVGEPIRLTCRPERLAARADRVVKTAAAFGGTANPWLETGGEKHFFVELPAGRAAAFRASLLGDGATTGPAISPAPAAAADPLGPKDQVEVFIRTNADE